MAPQLLCLQLLLSMWGWGTAVSGSSLPAPAAVCMPGMMTAPFLLRQTLPFCGGTLGSATCCTVEDDAKLHQAFMEDIKNHDYDPQCTSTMKAIICAVCLPSAPAAVELFINQTARTNNDSSLALRCAAPSSVSTHDLTSPSTTEPPTPDWLLADDDKDSATPKLLIALLATVLSALAGLLGGFVYKVFKARLECCNNNQCCSNTNCCCLCLV